MRLVVPGILAALLGTSACSPPDAVYDLGGTGGSGCGPGSVGEIVDDFGDPAKASAWHSAADSPVTILRQNGQLEITVPSGDTGAGNYYYPNMDKDPRTIRGCRLSVQVVQVGAEASYAFTYFMVRDVDDPNSNVDSHRLEISQTGANLLFTGGTPDSIQYDASLHKYWRIRESGGTVFFETSSDGGKWSIRAQGATPAFVDHVRIELGLSVHPAAGTATKAIFDNVNVVP